MTGIPALIGSLKKNQSVIAELAATTQKELATILSETQQLLQLAEQIQENWETQQAREEELNRDAAALDGELAAESREKGKLESTDATQSQALVDIKAEREKLEQQVSTEEKRLEELEDAVRTIERTLREKDGSLGESDAKLKAIDDQFIDKIEELKEKAALAEEEAGLLEAKYKALRYLLKENIITMPEAKVAMELKGRDTTTIDHLAKTTFIGRIKVKDILDQLAKHGIIELDKAGQVRVLKTIDL
jgi:DNA repair exonuclease SbcCD ATPase subunit